MQSMDRTERKDERNERELEKGREKPTIDKGAFEG
jgi:hypothetical protein